MTTDFHFLGEVDERLVSRARDMAYVIRLDPHRLIDPGQAVMLDELVDRVYRLHEREEELARERENADNLNALDEESARFTELCDAVADVRDELRSEAVPDDISVADLRRAVAEDLDNALPDRWGR